MMESNVGKMRIIHKNPNINLSTTIPQELTRLLQPDLLTHSHTGFQKCVKCTCTQGAQF